MHTRSYARWLLVSFTALLALVLYTPAFAAQPVDPATLNPPPPAQFNPSCQAVGRGTICDIAFSELQGPDGTGLTCDSGSNSFEVVSQDTRTVTGRRYYDRNGNLTQRHFREVLMGTFTNPLTGASLNFVQADTIIHDLAVPGDLNTGTQTSTGSTRLSRTHGGVVLIDAGRSVIAVSDGTILFEAGQHPFDAYYVFGQTAALQPVCDALA